QGLEQAQQDVRLLLRLLEALDALDEVIALIRRSPTVEEARSGLMELLGIDEAQAQAILNMQLRRLAALERQKIQDRHAELQRLIAEYEEIIASEARQREIISEELAEIVERYGDDRRTEVLYGFDGDVSMEDLIPQQQVVVTITRDGYVKRTRADEYRAQHRGGRGIKGAQLRGDDVVEHFFVTNTHHWILFFTTLGRVYRVKAYEFVEAGRDAKGQHVANLMEFQPEERIAKVMELRSYQDAPYLVLATRNGLVKKSRLTDYDTNRSAGVIAINLRDDDELVSAMLVDTDDDVMLISRHGQSLRFRADDDALRPMGRATSGVTGMKFRSGDELLSANVVHDDSHVFVVTEGGYAKRTSVQEYRVQGRGGLGIKVAKLAEVRGGLVGGLIVGENDEVLVVMESGKVVRSTVSEVPARGRDTMGVIFAKPGPEDTIVGVARNAEREIEKEVAEEDAAHGTGPGGVVGEGRDTGSGDVVPEGTGDGQADSDGQNDAVALEDNDNGGDA
ncbi:DNA gyrase subunit A, partial [Kocuria rhizophila]|uniref:DNA gyrase C-terminal beta-propeller domain-containing protein n=1 Tax=Kocuria rhizophila TaxID=72000 RepID=UPI0010FFE336